MSEALTVRAALRGDVGFLVDSNAAMAFETEHKRLNRDLLRRGTEAVFDAPHRGFYLVAERSGFPVGCLLITYEWSDWRNGDWWWIQSVYVTSSARRSGVFSALYSDVERRARAAADVVGLRLYVERENETAQATYATLGMRDAGYRLLEAGFAKR